MAATKANSLPDALYSADTVRAMDRYLIDQKGVDGFVLMQSAARSAFRHMLKRWPSPGAVLVLCGAGNNGGDGYLVAASAKRHGLPVSCVAIAPVNKLSGDALRAMETARSEGVPIVELGELGDDGLPDRLAEAELVVDAMLGTGVTGAPRAPFDQVIQAVNQSQRPVLAVDVPSGLDATSGSAGGDVVRADLTVTFIGAKAGLYTGAGAGACGQVVFDALATQEQLADFEAEPVARLTDWSGCRSKVPRRPLDAHKGRFGHVLVVAGDRGFGGAGLMTAEAAGRSGAGLVSLATRAEHVTAALARCPSVMVRGVEHGNELSPLLDRADVVLCGPGLGQGAWGQQMLQAVMASGKPLVLDADALNLIAGGVALSAAPAVTTPHPGEAARLLGWAVRDIENDRLAAARQLQHRYGGTVLLKGAGTVVYDGRTAPVIIAGGNPGMATGGMGDVLTGVIGGLLGQVSEPALATVIAASAHLAAADRQVARFGYMGLLPADVIDGLPEIFREAELVQIGTDREDV
ncbi:NAD(P)H-hydrate dehydratase [Marinobacter oulmenensis]|uniref:Bifunctional NAD(P)H-hydrate repair enzyme n=1 Tax=Marinobacter oulmenensis TaxID=643747 RepID=A0A840U8M2_9GAMM|nr:NAD(P)H-hydrate dehydratase [Marinobacter oulmenensis]MBB5322064.1 NAD(P)H-hydrate epimerase [Marinobacter oulmenensis]